jgi:hypothetical protein
MMRMGERIRVLRRECNRLADENERLRKDRDTEQLARENDSGKGFTREDLKRGTYIPDREGEE